MPFYPFLCFNTPLIWQQSDYNRVGTQFSQYSHAQTCPLEIYGFTPLQSALELKGYIVTELDSDLQLGGVTGCHKMSDTIKIYKV